MDAAAVELLVLLSSVTTSLSFFNVCFSLFFVFSAASSEEGPSSSARPKCTIMTMIFLPVVCAAI